MAITFINPREMRELRVIEQVTGARIRREEVPTGAEVEARDVQVLEERLAEALASGKWGRYRAVVEGLLDDHDAVDIASAALSLVSARTSRAARAHYEPVAAEPVFNRPPERPQHQPGRPWRRAEPPVYKRRFDGPRSRPPRKPWDAD